MVRSIQHPVNILSKLQKALRRLMIHIKFDEYYNSFFDLLRGPRKNSFLNRHSLPDSLSDELSEIRNYAFRRTDISDHLVTLFVESMCICPRLIVELGVRGGESTLVLERVARASGSKLISVDIDQVERLSSYHNWIFVQSDDVNFAHRFSNWCAEHKIDANIDVLFIDTSHLFEHTVEEIEYWFPFLSPVAKVFFHDTNLLDVFWRVDGSLGFAWNNNRGVIAAIEKYLGVSYDEKKPFIDLRNGWLVRHWPTCCGFTVLERLQPSGMKKTPKENL